MGCVLSVDPKVGEVLKAIEKDTVQSKESSAANSFRISHTTHKFDTEECEDFEEGYSDDEMFTAVEPIAVENSEKDKEDNHYFRSWILDICFKNMGWIFRGNQVTVSFGEFTLALLSLFLSLF